MSGASGWYVRRMPCPRCLLLLLAVACAKQAPAPGGATSDDAVARWNEAMQASDFETAARTMAPGYKERWLVRAVALMPAFTIRDPKFGEELDRIAEKHDVTFDGRVFPDPLEEKNLETVRRRIATADTNTLLADVLRASTGMFRRLASDTGYPEDRGRVFDVSGWLSEGLRTVEVDGRWFIVLPLPTSTTR
jgi:hypothetical protein